MSGKRRKETRRQAIEKILETLPWQQRKKIIEAGVKFRKPADLAEVERLYYQATGQRPLKQIEGIVLEED